jgi:hypothetical protein
MSKTDDTLSESEFVALPRDEILKIISDFGRPKVGVFVPDGSRRLVLAYTSFEPDSDAFYRASAQIPADFVLRSLKVFFDYGLPVLLVPILGSSILKRGAKYRALTLLEGLRILFCSQDVLDFYHHYQIQVRIYGQPAILKNTECEPALEWIEEACHQTAGYSRHKLFYGIGEPPIVGEYAAKLGAEFALREGRLPTTSDLICANYGEDLPVADFFIMTSKMSGMNALPNWLVNGDTELYFLPTVMGLIEKNYCRILYDLLYDRNGLRSGIEEFDTSDNIRQKLRQVYEKSIDNVVGIGFEVGKIWTITLKE